ncbi:MAG: hypothetical protein EP319_03095, partial [Deltaproteobacteria bacterium]
MQKIEKYTPLMIMAIFFVCCVWNISTKVIGDEVIYLFSEMTNVSYLDFIPGLSQVDYFYGHPPGYPLILRVLLDISGQSIMFAKLFNLTVSTFLLYGLYKLLTNSNNKCVALFFILTIATNQLFITHSTMLYPDIPFFACGVFGWLAYERKNFKSFVIWMFLCLFIRESGMAFLAPPVIFSFFKKERNEFDKKTIIAGFVLTLLLILFFFTHYISYGTFFGNKELLGRTEQGFSLLSINKEKLISFDLNLFIIKSFATTLPFSLFLYLVLVKVFPKLPAMKWNQKILFFPFAAILCFSLFILAAPESVAFKYHHILVNFNYLAKAMPAIFFFHLLIGKEMVIEYRPDTKLFMSLSACIFILIFYFFYQDSSPRNLLAPIILYLFGFYLLLPTLIKRKSSIVSLSISLLILQNIWFKVPQIPKFHTHPTLYKEILTVIGEVSTFISKEKLPNVYSSNEFMDLIQTPLYGWLKKDQIRRVDNIQTADIVISTNYYPKTIDEDLKKLLLE